MRKLYIALALIFSALECSKSEAKAANFVFSGMYPNSLGHSNISGSFAYDTDTQAAEGVWFNDHGYPFEAAFNTTGPVDVYTGQGHFTANSLFITARYNELTPDRAFYEILSSVFDKTGLERRLLIDFDATNTGPAGNLPKTLSATNALFALLDDNGGNVGFVNIRNEVSAAPEPATWTMMILGFGMVGGALRLRRRRSKVGCGAIGTGLQMSAANEASPS